MEININVKGKEYKISNEGFYPMILFKRLTGKNFEMTEDIEELLTLIYCYLKAYNKELDFELEDFFVVANTETIEAFTKLYNSTEEEIKKK